MVKYLLTLLLMIHFGACCQISYGNEIAIRKEERWQAIAEFLAGKDLTNQKDFPEMVSRQKAAEYQTHRQFMADLQKKVKEGNLLLMRDWQRKNLEDPVTKTVAMYPLSGGDLLNFYAMFPDASEYIMIALEKPGLITDINYLTPQQTNYGLLNIRTVLTNIAAVNYFFSRTMNETLVNPIFSGVLPVLLIFSNWLDFVVHKVEYVAMAENGQVVEATFNNQHLTHGLRIFFKKPNQEKIYTLIYWNMFIKNEVVAQGHAFRNYLDAKASLSIMFKAAVYLMHDQRYNKVRDFFLTKADLIIQDDSGVPYRNFNKNQWLFSLYGQFLKPANIPNVVPRNPVQPELVEAFAKGSLPLPFQYGYGTWFGREKANLLIARKKKSS